MHYEEAQPAPYLRKYVKCFWTLEQQTAAIQNAPEAVLPDGCAELIFNLSDRFRRHFFDGASELQPQTIVVGQMRRGVTIEPSGEVSLFGIRFQPAGAFPFFDLPQALLTDKIEALDSVWGKGGKIIEEKINDAPTFKTRIAVIEEIFTTKLAECRSPIALASEASQIILKCAGAVSIEKLSNKLGVGWRRLEREFRQKVGVSPKFLCRAARLQNVLGTLKNPGEKNLLDVALAAGFYDQSHFVHEFKEFSGKSPRAFFEHERRIVDFFIGS